ncbi:MAG: NAD-dependent epimerase/dehydratase family protein [Candidatus Dadabacteria bacterium]|nr:NAD-dependent epimerase/dehydratase family protein [Candidatus Dadabacteria bacterium]
MKAAVTGGTGFIGGRLVEELVSRGHAVTCLVRDTSNVVTLKELGVRLLHGDLGNPDSLRRLPGGADVVFHVAAMVSDWGPREDFFEYNVEATRALLSASSASGVKRFVYMSSSTVVWQSDFRSVHDLVDIDETFPYRDKYNDSYNASKAEAERLVVGYNGMSGLETAVIRPSNVWGAGDTVILPRVAGAARKGILFPMGSGKRTVTPCHVDNLARAMILAAESPSAPGNIYFINDGVKIGYMEFLTKQLRAAGIEWKPGFSIPYKLAYSVAAVMEALFKLAGSKKPPVLTRFAVAALAGSRSYSIDKARRELGYEPSVPLDEGMARLADWVKLLGGTDELLKF